MNTEYGAPALLPSVDESLVRLRERRQQVADDVQAARKAEDVQAYIKLLPQLAALERTLTEAEDRALRLQREGPQHPAWQVRREQLEHAFAEYYGRRGPQYEILVKHVVAAQLRFEQAEASGRDIAIDEFRKLLRGAQDAIAALQRYTESTKVDHSEGRMEGINVVLRVIEEVVSPAYPELYAHIVDTLIERAKGGRGALSQKANRATDPVR